MEWLCCSGKAVIIDVMTILSSAMPADMNTLLDVT